MGQLGLKYSSSVSRLQGVSDANKKADTETPRGDVSSLQPVCIKAAAEREKTCMCSKTKEQLVLLRRKSFNLVSREGNIRGTSTTNWIYFFCGVSVMSCQDSDPLHGFNTFKVRLISCVFFFSLVCSNVVSLQLLQQCLTQIFRQKLEKQPFKTLKYKRQNLVC